MKYKLITFLLLGMLSLTLTACTLSPGASTSENPTGTNTTNEQGTEQPENYENTTNNETTFTGKITELLGMSDSLKCTITDNADYTGEIYISGQKMRADVTATIREEGSEQKIETHMISDGDWLYTWSSVVPMGIKMNLSQIETEAEETAGAETPQSGAINNDFEYKCSPWVIDQEVFSLPSNITFTDTSSLINSFGM